jgi:hypothetical protein
MGLAARIFALDNQDILLSSWNDLTNNLSSPASLYCRAEALTVVPTNFAQIDFATVSYVIVAPGVSESPVQKYARCRVHDHSVNTDGTVVAGTNQYPPRLIVGHPLSLTVEPNAAGALTVLTGDAITGPIRYQWRRLQPFDASGEPFTNTVRITDATNRTLNLPNAGPQDEGYYDVIVWDGQGGYQLSAMAYLAVGPLTSLLGDASWETNACASNLRQIGLAGRISGSGTKVLPDSLAALPPYLGWPVVLFCPSDGSRVAPDLWQNVDFDDTGYVLSRGIPYEATNSILATCKIHGFQVRTDGRTVIMSGTQPLAPRLEVASSGPTGALVVTIRGVAGTECIVASSPDLLSWTPVTTHLLVEGTLRLTNALWLNESLRFYRASVR